MWMGGWMAVGREWYSGVKGGVIGVGSKDRYNSV